MILCNHIVSKYTIFILAIFQIFYRGCTAFQIHDNISPSLASTTTKPCKSLCLLSSANNGGETDDVYSDRLSFIRTRCDNSLSMCKKSTYHFLPLTVITTTSSPRHYPCRFSFTKRRCHQHQHSTLLKANQNDLCDDDVDNNVTEHEGTSSKGTKRNQKRTSKTKTTKVKSTKKKKPKTITSTAQSDISKEENKKKTSTKRKTKKTTKKKSKKASRVQSKTKKTKADTIYFWSNKTDLCLVQNPSSVTSLNTNSTDETEISMEQSSAIIPFILSLQNETATISSPFTIQKDQTALLQDSSSATMTTMTSTQPTIIDKIIHVTVRGNPLPLQRHRTFRNFVYNPSAQKQKQFRETVISMLPTICFNNNETLVDFSSLKTCYEDDDDALHRIAVNQTIHHTKDTFDAGNKNNIQPFFNDEEYIKVKMIFHLKRPKNHFKSNIPGPNRIKERYKSIRCVSTRVDVDNLAKFVLDSLNGVLYVDDRQVMELHVMKVFDNDDVCAGKTEVWISRLDDDDNLYL